MRSLLVYSSLLFACNPGSGDTASETSGSATTEATAIATEGPTTSGTSSTAGSGTSGSGTSGPGSSGSSESGSSGASTTGFSTSEPGTSGSTGPSCEGDCQDQFGFTCVALERGQGLNGDPFVGTAKIRATLHYAPCLLDYYAVKHPEMQFEGPVGSLVFAAWKDRLCSEPIGLRADCSVEAFEQVFLPGEGEMSITYLTPDAAALEGRLLLWGPGPLPAFAGCDPGLQPLVQLSGPSDVVGLDEANNVLWKVQNFGASKGVMGLSGSGCIEIFVAPA